MISLKSFTANPKKQGLLVLITAVLFFSWLQASPALADPDSFYHLKLALLIEEKGVIQNFPWLQATVLKDNFVDHHFLYHVLLIPFVTIFNPVVGGKISQVIFASLAVWLIYWLLQKYCLKGAFFYPFLLFSSTILVSRLSLVKAPALSLAILILALYLVMNKKSSWLFFLSFFYVWTYGGWPMILVLTVLTIAGEGFFLLSDKIGSCRTRAKIIRESITALVKNFLRKENLKLLSAVFAGAAAGLIINPYFPKNLSFHWIQAVKIGLGNLQYIIDVGSEWYPLNPAQLFWGMALVLFLWLFSLVWFFIKIKSQPRESFGLLLFSFFLFLIMVKSQRYGEYFIPFALISTAFSLNSFWQEADWQKLVERLKTLSLPPITNLVIFIGYWILLALIAVGLLVSDSLFSVKTWLSGPTRVSYLEKSASYLKNNTPQGSVVFNGSWDDFPMLFYYNDHNYYLNGLDQTFMYLKDPVLYSLWVKITNGEIDGKILPVIMKEDLGTDYVLVPKEKHFTKMSENIKKNNLFVNIYEDEEAAVYKIGL
ncbi:MAG: hypothetical protein Q8N16_04195 [bacterium]|nr:hypothetical protein [bacterium]